MKQRIISGVFIAIITILSIALGGIFLKCVLGFIAVYGTYEFIKIRKSRFNFFLYLIMLGYILCIYFYYEYATSILLFALVLLLTISVFNEKETFTDVSALFLMSNLLAFAIHFIDYIETFNKFMLANIFIICYLSDVFAYFIGRKFGKHKLNSRVSPKKTIEGSLGGWLFGSLLSLLWSLIFKFYYMDYRVIVIASIFLPLVSEVGDLIFSLIKRHYGVKDFSNLIPGHGGLLDRLDSLLITIIFFGAFITLFV